MRKLKESIEPNVREAGDEDVENAEVVKNNPSPEQPEQTNTSQARELDTPASEQKHSWIGRIASSLFSKLIPTNVFDKIYKMIDGAIWGMIEGYATGSMVGAYNVGRGGWMSVLIANTIGAPAGAIVGALSGSIIGFMSDREKVSDTIKTYRNLTFEEKLRKDKSGKDKSGGGAQSVVCNRQVPVY